ncbi:MAG: hypothetical protein ACM3MK_03465 [Chitinophagales bacterium]
MKNKLIGKLIPVIMAGAIIFSSASVLLANTGQQTSSQTATQINGAREPGRPGGPGGPGGAGMYSAEYLSQLVEKNLITQEQADKWTAFNKQKEEAMKTEMEKIKNMTDEERQAYMESNSKEPQAPLSDVVAAGIITQDEADKILKEMPQCDDQKGPGGTSTEYLAQLVEKSIISQEQADKWTAYDTEKDAARKAEMESAKNMTDEERQAKMAEDSKDRPNPLSDIVSQGIITQDEADKILKEAPEHGQKGPGRNSADYLAQLVEKDLITQEQADKWTAYDEEKEAARKAEMESAKNMTDEERQAKMTEDSKDRPNPLSNIVSQGIITQDQADQILKEMPQVCGGPGQGPGQPPEPGEGPAPKDTTSQS